MEIRTADTVGYRIGNETVYLKCVRKEELHNLEEDEIITIGELEERDNFYICDRHKGHFHLLNLPLR